MSRFTKLKNVIEISVDHYGEKHRDEKEKAHALTIKAAPFRYVNIRTIDEVVPTTATVKDENDNDVEIDAVYLIQHHEGAISDFASGHARDRDSFFLVPGTADEWVEKIETLIASDIAAHHPQPEQEAPVHCLTDRGVWKSGESYSQFDLVTHPDGGKKFVALRPSKSTSSAVLANSKFWAEIVLPE